MGWENAGLLGEVRALLRGGAQGGEAERRVLRHGPAQGRGHGGREHHLCRRHPRLHAQRRVRGREAAQRPAHPEERRDRVIGTLYPCKRSSMFRCARASSVDP
jgi:hypothetical protein